MRCEVVCAEKQSISIYFTMIIKCEVCTEQAFKYKCPKCLTKYCSVSCFKLHKDSQCSSPVKEDPTKPSESHKDEKNIQEQVSGRHYIGVTEDTVSKQCLERLGTSSEVKDLLHNPSLRQLLQQVNSAGNAQVAMRDAMREPLFLEFADACLSVVEPSADLEPQELAMEDLEDET